MKRASEKLRQSLRQPTITVVFKDAHGPSFSKATAVRSNAERPAATSTELPGRSNNLASVNFCTWPKGMRIEKEGPENPTC